MKRNLSTPILDIHGEALKDGEKDFTLKTACLRALGSTLPGDEKMQADEKMQMFALAMKLAPMDEVDLSAEEIASLKQRIGTAFHFVIVGRCFDLLDPKE